MEHIVQFAIGIDDEAIKKRIEERSVEKIENDLKSAIIGKIFEHGAVTTRGAEYYWVQKWAEEIFTRFLGEHKNEIIKAAANVVAEKTYRSKKWRVSVAAIIDEILKEEAVK